MKEKSLKDRIRLFLKRGWLRDPERWCNGGTIERLAIEAGYKGQTAGRRCREMESGKLSNGKTCPIVLESKLVKNPKTGVESVWYRYKPTQHDLIKREIESRLST